MGLRGPAKQGLDRAAGIAGKPTKPAWLKDEAAKLWPQVLKNLAALGTLSKSDGIPIARYCRNIIAWLKACDAAEQFGDLIAKPRKAEMSDEDFKAYVTTARRKRFQALALEKVVLQFERDFGFSAASRLSLDIQIKSGVTKVSSRPRFDMAVIAPEHAR